MRTIVVGVDGSDGSRAALRWAAHEARLDGARIVAIHAWTYPVSGALPYADLQTMAHDELRDAAEQTLKEAVAEALSGNDSLEVEERLVHGHAADQLVQATAAGDLLVVGTRGRGGFAGLLLGSTSQQCVQHARCPVVVVPTPSR